LKGRISSDKEQVGRLDGYGAPARHVDPTEAFRRGGGQPVPRQGRQ
jgi:hypothetical protein